LCTIFAKIYDYLPASKFAEIVMNEKSIENGADGFLVLLLPVAFVIVFLFATWPFILGLLALILGFNAWQRYQWQQWSQQVNPIFHRVIQENQGRITPLDLAMKANFSASTAKRYLDSKAEEFGAQQQDYEGLGSVYYFITSSTLGSMFDKSEPLRELEQQDERTKDIGQIAAQTIDSNVKEKSEPAVEVIAPDETSSDSMHTTSPVAEISAATLEQPESLSHTQSVPQSLIQSELAKRLNVYSSTVYKRRDDPDFSEWTRNRDPDGIAWKFSSKTKEFHPVAEES
jgi:hypothetical protein